MDASIVRALLTDIEGTTSSLSFVKDVLFPYSRARLPDFVHAHRTDRAVRQILDEVRASAGPDLDDDGAVAELIRWIDEDRKATPLKSLQGMIWETGYRNGDFTGHVYDDAVTALRNWHTRGIRLYVYSSGSIKAQQLLFGHTDFGDLTPLFSGYFDTTIGGKKEAASYRHIAKTIGLPPDDILFLSDIKDELDAARIAGLKTCWLVRDGGDSDGSHPIARDFTQVKIVHA